MTEFNSKVSYPTQELIDRLVQTRSQSWARYSNRPDVGVPALGIPSYKGLNLPRLLDILRLRRESYYQEQLEWFTPMLAQAMHVTDASAKSVQDAYGNVFILIDDGTRASDVAFTSHLDTVASGKTPWDSGHDIMLSDGGILFLKDGTQADCLGADDGVGIFIMLEMIRAGVPGRYCFFQDEEVGRQGSEFSAKDDTGFWTGVNWMVSFDRRNDGVVSSQLSGRCCSDTFAFELTRRLGRPESAVQAGIYTDSASFMHLIPECTNIGVGYADEHTQDETLDLNILANLMPYVLNPETWRDLPVQRVPVQNDYFSFGRLGTGWDDDVPESNELEEVFRTVSSLGKTELIKWMADNPNTAAAYLMTFSDYGFKQELLDVGNRVCNDWGGFEELLKDTA